MNVVLFHVLNSNLKAREVTYQVREGTSKIWSLKLMILTLKLGFRKEVRERVERGRKSFK